ncbi:MAG: hypothetical protein AB7I35_12835 [Ramlibacter sp.]
MAEPNTNGEMRSASKPVEYDRDHDWCEDISGTKRQLQAYGLGIGQAFPGEPNGPSGELEVIDPRGFLARIFGKPGYYVARIPYPNWPKPLSYKSPAEIRADGIKHIRCRWFDDFVGRADALVAAGLCERHHLPGMPGRPKNTVYVFADGTAYEGPPHAATPGLFDRKRAPGAKMITRTGKSFKITVYIEDAERIRRDRAEAVARAERDALVRQLRRPDKLRPIYEERQQGLQRAQAVAQGDGAFQSLLSRLVGGGDST